jgi:DNA-binding winged helix-turn-helix (wHTH) protein/tetratricopeptide (TPR) repeat protein
MKQITSDASSTESRTYSFGGLRLEPDGNLLRGDTSIHLPPKELDALRFLLSHAGEIVSPAELKSALWGRLHVTEDSVPRCVSSLRARLEPEECIQTIYKRGYRFTAPLHTIPKAPPALPRLAIMPFATGPYIPAHLGTAVAEEITTGLTAMRPPIAAVLARDSVFTLAHDGATAQKIGEILDADLVLVGTLLALPSHFRLRAEMIRIADGTQIWTEDLLVSRDRSSSLEGEMMRRLIVRLGGSQARAHDPEVAETTDDPVHSEAYEAFLRGHQEWQSLERHRMQEAMQDLLRATKLDPSLLAAQIDLVQLCVTQSLFGFMTPMSASEEIRRIAAAIPDVVNDTPSILPALGWISFHIDRDLREANRLFEQCANLPHDLLTTRLRVMFALSRHRFDEAIQMLHSALQIDPFAPWLHARLAWTYHLAAKRNESMHEIEKCLRLFPDHESTAFYGAIIFAFNGDARRGTRLAEDLAQKTPYLDIAMAIQAYSYVCAGNHDNARLTLERMQWLSRERFVLRTFTAGAYAALGDVDAAIAELRESEQARCPWFFQMLADPRLQPLHGHPEFERMRTILDDVEAAAVGKPEHFY